MDKFLRLAQWSLAFLGVALTVGAYSNWQRHGPALDDSEMTIQRTTTENGRMSFTIMNRTDRDMKLVGVEAC